MDNTFINQHNLTQSIFNAGNAGVVQNLSGRVPNIQSLLSGNASLASAMNTINTIPGVGNALNNLENNPLGALTQFSGLNLQAGLPSLASLGGAAAGAPGLTSAGGANSLTQAFGLASSVAGSSIPSSITGAVQLALQVKTIVCNLKIPNITVPDIQSLLKANFTSLEKQVGQLLLHEVQEIVDEIFNPIKKIIDQLSDFFSPEKIKKLLASIIPDVNDLIKNTVDQFTKCNNGPAAKKNDLSGKDPTGTAPAAVSDTTVPQSPSTGQAALNSAANANAFLNSAPASSSGPTFSNATETNYNADGTVAPPGVPPVPGTASAPASLLSPPAPLLSAQSQVAVNPFANTATQLQANTAPVSQNNAPNANTVYAPAGFNYTP